MSIFNYQDLRNERDMLDWNLSRLMVTKDMEELKTRVCSAKIIIDEIADYRKKEIKEMEMEVKE